MKIKTPIATKSCIISIPIDIFPCNDSKCFLSEKSFITIIVLLNAIAIPIYTEVIKLNSKNIEETKNPNTNVIIIWDNPINKEEIPISFITLGFKCSPTIKSKNAIPNFENVLIIPWDAAMSK